MMGLHLSIELLHSKPQAGVGVGGTGVGVGVGGTGVEVEVGGIGV